MPSAISTPRSILKSTSSHELVALENSTLTRNERNRQIALHHARLLQHRKDIESLILSSTETLLDLPSLSSRPSSSPSPSDVSKVKNALKPFQRSDFDELVEERNIDDKCGYVLCGKPNRRQTTKSKYRVLTGRGDGMETGFKVVERRELERWCSDDCGRRALFLRVQLSIEPAWTRDWETTAPVIFPHEQNDRKENETQADGYQNHTQRVERAVCEAEIKANLKDLALERGETEETGRASSVFTKTIVEKASYDIEPSPPSTDKEGNLGGAIEGYIPQSTLKAPNSVKKGNVQDNNGKNFMDTI